MRPAIFIVRDWIGQGQDMANGEDLRKKFLNFNLNFNYFIFSCHIPDIYNPLEMVYNLHQEQTSLNLEM